jgi:hypothetical protein
METPQARIGNLTRAARRRIATGLISVLAFAALSACAGAQDSDSGLKSAAKALGFATDVGPPADFVRASRSKDKLDYIPVFKPPAEPPSAALDAKAQKAISDDLEAANRRDLALRGGAPAKLKTSVKKPLKKPLAGHDTPPDKSD